MKSAVKLAGWGVAFALSAGCQNNTIKLEFGTDGGTGTSAGTATAAGTSSGGHMNGTGGVTPGTSAASGPVMTGGGEATGNPTAGNATTGVVEVSFFADVAPILQQYCAPGCHEPGGQFESQDLLNSPYFALVGVPATELPSMNKVEPGSLDTSYMWQKLNDTQLSVGGSGVQMPNGQPPLDAGSMNIISSWILAGAPNN